MKKLWKKFKHWCCKAGLCNLDKCNCDCHPQGRSKAYYPTAAKKKQAKTAGSKIKSKSRETTYGSRERD